MAIIANSGNGHLAVPFHPVTSAKGDGLHLMLMALGTLIGFTMHPGLHLVFLRRLGLTSSSTDAAKDGAKIPASVIELMANQTRFLAALASASIRFP